MNTSTKLSERLRKLAAEGHPEAVDLREQADAFDAAAHGFYGEPQTVSVQKFMGVYARTRRLWCEITGENL